MHVDWMVQKLSTAFHLNTRWNQPTEWDIFSTAHVNVAICRIGSIVWYLVHAVCLDILTIKSLFLLHDGLTSWICRSRTQSVWWSGEFVGVFLTLHQVGDFINVVMVTNIAVSKIVPGRHLIEPKLPIFSIKWSNPLRFLFLFGNSFKNSWTLYCFFFFTQFFN